MPDQMRGDDTLGGQDGSDYQYTHRNKRSITLNLKEPEGIAIRDCWRYPTNFRDPTLRIADGSSGTFKGFGNFIKRALIFSAGPARYA